MTPTTSTTTAQSTSGPTTTNAITSPSSNPLYRNNRFTHQKGQYSHGPGPTINMDELFQPGPNHPPSLSIPEKKAPADRSDTGACYVLLPSTSSIPMSSNPFSVLDQVGESKLESTVARPPLQQEDNKVPRTQPTAQKSPSPPQGDLARLPNMQDDGDDEPAEAPPTVSTPSAASPVTELKHVTQKSSSSPGKSASLAPTTHVPSQPLLSEVGAFPTAMRPSPLSPIPPLVHLTQQPRTSIPSSDENNPQAHMEDIPTQKTTRAPRRRSRSKGRSAKRPHEIRGSSPARRNKRGTSEIQSPPRRPRHEPPERTDGIEKTDPPDRI